MGRRTKAAARAARYRQRKRQNAASPADVEKRIAEVRATAKPSAPADLVADYARISILLDQEHAGKGRSRSIRELTDAKLALARELGLTPKERRLSGEGSDMVPMADVAKSIRNVLRVQRTRWESMKMEIRLFGNKEDPAGQTRAMYVEEVGKLKANAPDLFNADEMTATPEDLYDQIVATAPARLPGEEEPA